MSQQAGGKLAEVTIAFQDQGKYVTGVASQPVVGLLELALSALRGNVLKHRRADRIRGDRVIEQRLADRVEALERVPEHGAALLNHGIEVVLGAAVRGRHHLAVHVDQVIQRVPLA